MGKNFKKNPLYLSSQVKYDPTDLSDFTLRFQTLNFVKRNGIYFIYLSDLNCCPYEENRTEPDHIVPPSPPPWIPTSHKYLCRSCEPKKTRPQCQRLAGGTGHRRSVVRFFPCNRHCMQCTLGQNISKIRTTQWGLKKEEKRQTKIFRVWHQSCPYCRFILLVVCFY